MEACTAALPSNGGVVLMSPACASFGLFPNYKVRGETFRAQAKLLAASLDRAEH
jgi:UDP-N-acetylmuramoylalanine-D-glutamate ligase